jgi:hypothetical protein
VQIKQNLKIERTKFYSIKGKIYKCKYSIYNKDLYKVLYCLINIKNTKDYFYTDYWLKNLYKYTKNKTYLKIKNDLHLIKLVCKLKKVEKWKEK